MCHVTVTGLGHPCLMFTLRPAFHTDTGFLTQLEHAVMAGHALSLWGRFSQSELSSFDLGNTRVVEMDKMPIGYLTIENAGDHLRLRKLYLIPSAQGRGLGSRLLAHAVTEANRCALPLRLSVLRPNSRALAFYLREGLEIQETTADRIFLTTRPALENRRSAL